MFYSRKNKVFWLPEFYLMYQLFKKVTCFSIVLFFLSLPIFANRAGERENPVGRIFDCGANCLYIIGQIQGRPVSYEKCLELLPLSSQGNSMLQLKDALEAMSYQVYAMSVSAEELKCIKVPTIVRDNFGQQDRRLGHYVVMRPLSRNQAQIFDYPKDAKVISLVDLFQSKSTENLKHIPVLLCCDKNQELNQVFDCHSKEPETLIVETYPVSSTTCNTSRVAINLTSKKYYSKYDFGELPEGSEISHKFIIQNNSPKTLIVDKVMASCQCAGIRIDKKEIVSKGEAAVTMDISLDRKYGNVYIDGKVIFLPNNDIPPVALSINGVSFERWVCYPNTIDFGEIGPDNLSVTKSIIVEKSIQGKDTSISSIKTDSKSLETQLDAIASDKAILHLTFVNNGVAGPFRGKVDIFLDDEEIPATSIDVSASVKTYYTVSPRKIFFSHEPGAKDNKIVIISSADKQPFIVNSLKVEGVDPNTIVSDYWFNNEKNELTFDATPQSNCIEGTGCFNFNINKQGIDHIVRVPFVIIP